MDIKKHLHRIFRRIHDCAGLKYEKMIYEVKPTKIFHLNSQAPPAHHHYQTLCRDQWFEGNV